MPGGIKMGMHDISVKGAFSKDFALSLIIKF